MRARGKCDTKRSTSEPWGSFGGALGCRSRNATGFAKKSRPRQWADSSSPIYNPTPQTKFVIPPTAWADSSGPLLFISKFGLRKLEVRINRVDLNDPPTVVGGIPISLQVCVYRKDLNPAANFRWRDSNTAISQLQSTPHSRGRVSSRDRWTMYAPNAPMRRLGPNVILGIRPVSYS